MATSVYAYILILMRSEFLVLSVTHQLAASVPVVHSIACILQTFFINYHNSSPYVALLSVIVSVTFILMVQRCCYSQSSLCIFICIRKYVNVTIESAGLKTNVGSLVEALNPLFSAEHDRAHKT